MKGFLLANAGISRDPVMFGLRLHHLLKML